jgi:hypothetical protein
MGGPGVSTTTLERAALQRPACGLTSGARGLLCRRAAGDDWRTRLLRQGMVMVKVIEAMSEMMGGLALAPAPLHY